MRRLLLAVVKIIDGPSIEAINGLSSTLWTGSSVLEFVPVSGPCYTGRCNGYRAILETVLVSDGEPNSAPWSPVDEDHLEALERMLAGPLDSPHHGLAEPDAPADRAR